MTRWWPTASWWVPCPNGGTSRSPPRRDNTCTAVSPARPTPRHRPVRCIVWISSDRVSATGDPASGGPPNWTRRHPEGSKPGLSSSGGVLYYALRGAGISRLDARTGAVACWTAGTDTDGAAPIIAGDRVLYVATATPRTIRALAASSGRALWTSALPGHRHYLLPRLRPDRNPLPGRLRGRDPEARFRCGDLAMDPADRHFGEAVRGRSAHRSDGFGRSERGPGHEPVDRGGAVADGADQPGRGHGRRGARCCT